MGEKVNREKLRQHIIERSKSDDFNIAKEEWQLVEIEYSEAWDNCPCGQEIKKLCYIKNKFTKVKTYVGSTCIDNFMGMDTEKIFRGLKKIKEDINANANEALINYAWGLGYLYGEKEYKFLMDIKNKRRFTARQSEWKEKINKRILAGKIVKSEYKNNF